MRAITCFGDQTRTDNFVIVNVFNSVKSSRVTGNRNFARKCDTEFCSSF